MESQMTKWFTEDEIIGLDDKLVSMLDRARELAGIPFIITCGLVFDDKPGSHVSDSAHLRGLAADLRCPFSVWRFHMLPALLSVGFRRIGVYDKHLHADIDPSLPQDVIWWGVSK
jgi:hypothetical protein